MYLKCKMLSIFLMTAAAAGTVYAEEDFFSMSLEDLLKTEITVASTKSSDMINAVSSVTVIDRKMIRDYGFLSTAEAIRTVSGFQVYRTYLKRNLPTGRGILQDHYANKVLIMINGVPSWHAVTGEGNIDRIDIRNVERIEILKGPASVLYGSQAYSGAVNIVLRQQESSGSSKTAHIGGGNNGAYSAGGSWLFQSDNGTAAAVAINLREEDGKRIGFTDELGVSGKIREYVTSENVTLDLSHGEHSILLNAFSVNESYLGVVPRYSSGAGNNHDVDGILAAYSWKQEWSEGAMSDLQLYYDEHERNLSRNADDTIRAKILGRRYAASLKNNIDVSESVCIEFGADYEYRRSEEYSNYESGVLISENNLRDRHMYEYSGFLQAVYNADDWMLLAGTRHTENELFGDNLSSRVTASYRLSERSSVKLIFGQSFRAPSLFELYFITPGRTVFGSEELSPEKSESMELSYQTVIGNCYIQAIAYRASYDNLISRTIGSVTTEDGTVFDNVNVYANGDKAHANGAELEIKYILPGVMNLFLNADYMHQTDDSHHDTGNHFELMHSPEFTMTAGTQKSFGGFSAAAMLRYIDDTAGHDSELGASTALDLSFGYSTRFIGRRARHSLAAKNVLDEDSEFPEYVRRAELTAVPLEEGTSVFYTFEIEL